MDSLGLPVTLSGDGGDSVHICGTWMALDGKQTVQYPIWYYLGTKTPIRHPDSTMWYGREWRFSRDALVAFMCGLAFKPNSSLARSTARKVFVMHAKRAFLFAWNRFRNHVYPTKYEHLEKSTPDVPWRPEAKWSDPTGPEVWALWIRLFRAWYLYPLLILFDLETLFSAISWNLRSNNLVRNHLLVLHTCRNIMPTPVSMLAEWVTPVQELVVKHAVYCREVGEYDSSQDFDRAFKK